MTNEAIVVHHDIKGFIQTLGLKQTTCHEITTPTDHIYYLNRNAVLTSLIGLEVIHGESDVFIVSEGLNVMNLKEFYRK